jgi:uncharacterized protein (UPF0297 family)
MSEYGKIIIDIEEGEILLNIDATNLYDINDISDAMVEETIKEVYDALEERGYKAINQLVGYLISGDPGYISSYKDSRNKIRRLDRSKIIEILLKKYIK